MADDVGAAAPRAPRQEAGIDLDVRRLAELGYVQRLDRAWSAFSNFAISFTIISVLAGCLTTYFTAWNNGGPIAISWGWPIIVGLVLLVALSMSELVSKYPTAGGIYWWSSTIIWVAICVIIFSLPQVPSAVPWHSGFDWKYVNYAPLTVIAVLLITGVWWVVDARKRFTGPIREIDTDELGRVTEPPPPPGGAPPSPRGPEPAPGPATP